MKKIIGFLVLTLAIFQTLFAQTDFSVEKSVRYLASEALEGREAGTTGDSLAADYIAKTFASFGLKPFFEDYFQFFPIEGWNKTTRNVIAVKEGVDSILKNRYIIICAHFDALGRMMGDEDLCLGANDNASGTAAMLDLAQNFSQTPTSKTLIFGAFGAEEIGLLGAKYFTKNLPFLAENIDAVINFDMVGRLAYEGFSVKGEETSKMLKNLIKTEVQNSGKSITFSDSDDMFYTGSDHYRFYIKKIPFLCFTTGLDTAHYHTQKDVVENIDFNGIETISEIAFRLIKKLADTKSKPDFRPVNRKKTPSFIDGLKFGFSIALNFDNTFDNKITHLNTNGEMAGLQIGDALLKINRRKINSEKDFWKALTNEFFEFNKITVKRNQEKITVKIAQ